jgi:GNAT superfamily N-acetyltransferase
MSISIRRIAATNLEAHVPDLTRVFRETVNNGSPLGFMPPLTENQSRTYWLSLLPELRAGTRVLVAAFSDDDLVGSGQLALSQRANSPHRAEIEKLFVAPSARGRGIGKALMEALHHVAREHGRSLILLNTRHGEAPEHFYKGLGYRVTGVIPGWTIGPAGERYDHVTLYLDLSPPIV